MKTLTFILLIALATSGCMPKAPPVPTKYLVDVYERSTMKHLGVMSRDEKVRTLVQDLRIFCDVENIDMDELMTNYYFRIKTK